MGEKHLKKKEILRSGPASLLKFHFGTVFSFCLCKSTTWFLRKRNIDSKWVIPNGTIIELKKINELLQAAPLTVAWRTVPFKNRKS